MVKVCFEEHRRQFSGAPTMRKYTARPVAHRVHWRRTTRRRRSPIVAAACSSTRQEAPQRRHAMLAAWTSTTDAELTSMGFSAEPPSLNTAKRSRWRPSLSAARTSARRCALGERFFLAAMMVESFPEEVALHITARRTSSMARFFHYQLRTTDVAAARAFYAAVLGKDDAEIFPLHEQAVARGARPHWLGHLDVGEVDAAASAFAARGATSLGAKWVNPQGLAAAVVRDPGGAVVALSKPAPASSPGSARLSHPDVAWHQLNTVDVVRAKANYGEMMGWEFKEPLDLGGLGVFHPFAWQPGGAAVGWMSDIGKRPGIHPHWLFDLRVAALRPALETVRAGGGSIIGPFVLPNGDRLAVCDDPQGAAFGLFEGHG
jgi:predicted enzyme related to lactoylglutathione lyase